MSRESKTPFALLGLLSWKPMSGYDIKKIVDVGLAHFWNENYGQIYPALNSMVKQGLVTKSIDKHSGNRPRHLYHITPTGLSAFHEWLGQASNPPSVRNEMQLKFFLSSQMPAKTSLQIIRDYRHQQESALQGYKASETVIRAAIASGDYPDELQSILENQTRKRKPREKAKQCQIFLFTLRHGIRVMEARVQWCDEVLSELNQGDGP